METLQLLVRPGMYKRWCVTIENWDIGMVFGDGETIQEAIQDFLEMFECKFDRTPNYKWL